MITILLYSQDGSLMPYIIKDTKHNRMLKLYIETHDRPLNAKVYRSEVQ